MKFGLLYEHQLPRPWDAQAEYRMLMESLDQLELADQLGYDYAWENEHHFLEEYSHSSAPEVFLGAASQRTRQIKLGHAIVVNPPPFNHPARVAERIATLDLLSGGRAQFGTGESSSTIELGGFNVPPNEKHAMWQEALEQSVNMLTMEPYPGFEGRYFSMPCRNVLPKSLQKPHPPLWVACSNKKAILKAARQGLGVLALAFVDADEAARWAREYYDTLKRECEPIGHAVNPNIAMVTGFSCHDNAEEARARGMEGFEYFGYALGHYYVTGTHRPGVSNLWESFTSLRDTGKLPGGSAPYGIGTPAQVRDNMVAFEEAGVDQVIFIQQCGKNQHQHIMEAIQLFGTAVLPDFKHRDVQREQEKLEELTPHLQAAMARKRPMLPLAPEQVPSYGTLASQSDKYNPERVVANFGKGFFQVPDEQ